MYQNKVGKTRPYLFLQAGEVGVCLAIFFRLTVGMAFRRLACGFGSILVGEDVASAKAVSFDPANRRMGERFHKIEGAEHFLQLGVLIQALSFSSVQSGHRVLIVRKQGRRLAGEQVSSLFQRKQGGLQFEFVAADDGNRPGSDQGFAVRRGKEDGGESAMSFLAGVAEDLQVSGVERGEPHWQRAHRRVDDTNNFLFSSFRHAGWWANALPGRIAEVLV